MDMGNNRQREMRKVSVLSGGKLCNSLLSLQILEEAILFPTEWIVSALEFEGFGRRAQAEGVG